MDDVSPEKPHPKPIDENKEVVMVLESEGAIHIEEDDVKEVSFSEGKDESKVRKEIEEMDALLMLESGKIRENEPTLDML